MKLSLNWLKQFVEIPKNITPEKLAEVLTLKTVEVEGIEKQGENLENVVIGKIKEIKKHSNADKLKICIIDVGEKKDLQIICGGINLMEGMMVAVAKVGSRVRWHGEGDLVELKKVKLRGVESYGMICASSELGLEEIIKQEDEREIIDLDKLKEIKKFRNLEIGGNLNFFLELDDVIFDIDNKSLTHRPDLWSHYGIAREIAAILKFQHKESKKVNFSISQFLNFSSFKEASDKAAKAVKLDIVIKAEDLCPRYMALAMSGIRIEPSPQWMQNRLRSVGARPINNIVDITNFVMLELGQPMHPFDISKLSAKGGSQPKADKPPTGAKTFGGKNEKYALSEVEGFKIKIIIRRAGGAGSRDAINRVSTTEKITTLDGVERELDNEMLVIADAEKPIAIAGVMGGANSEIDENTTEIILESANFEKVNNRKTSAKLGLRTEAVMRYEKGLDTKLCEMALARCVELIKEIIPKSEVASEIVDVETRQCLVSTTVEISLDYIRKKMGVEIEEKKVVDILKSLGFGVESVCADRDAINRVSTTEVFKITVPSWRATGDISIPDDIVEEVSRIYGYDDIKPKMPYVELEPPLENKERTLERKIKNILSVNFGMAETSNYSFISEKALKELGWDANECVKLANPLSLEHTLLRPSLIPHLLENAKNNLRYFDDFSMFEIGGVFRDELGAIKSSSNFVVETRHASSKADFLPWQEKFVAGIVVMEKNSIPFFKVKEAVEGLLRELNIDSFVEQTGEVEENWMHPARTGVILTRQSFCKAKNSAGKDPVKSSKTMDNNIIGYITELNPVVAEKIGIKNARVGVFNLSLKALLELSGNEKKYKELPKYPSVLRDLAIVVDKKVLYKDIADLISKVDKLIKSVELFDIFESEKLGKDKKSMAFHIDFRSDERTLTDGEAEKIFANIVKKLKNKFGAEMRN